jgi:hypothetical protein
MPPLRAEMAAGQVSVYLLMNFRFIYRVKSVIDAT